MTKSESIGKLAEALAKAQGIMKGATKDSTNPFFKQSYADLSSVWEAAREPLSKNGLSVIQTLDNLEDKIVIETILAHSSGEWITSRIALKPAQTTGQGYGMIISYLRRYSLSAIIGGYADDNDAEGDREGHKQKKGKDDFLDTKKEGEKEKETLPDSTEKGYTKEGLWLKGEKKEKPITKDFKFLEAMAKQKDRIGEKKYYEILGVVGFEKSNEIIDKDMQLSIFNQLKKEPTLEEDIP